MHENKIAVDRAAPTFWIVSTLHTVFWCCIVTASSIKPEYWYMVKFRFVVAGAEALLIVCYAVMVILTFYNFTVAKITY